MIPYEDLVAALDEMNGRAPVAARPERKSRETGSVQRAASTPRAAAYPEQPTMTADVSDLLEEPALAAVEPVRDISMVTAEPDMDMLPLATAEPEPGDAFEVLTEEPLPPPADGVDGFDILSESELPPPPAPPPADGQGHLDEVFGENAFSNFFDSGPEAPAGNVQEENDLYDAPTPPPEDSGEFLPPPPEDWK